MTNLRFFSSQPLLHMHVVVYDGPDALQISMVEASAHCTATSHMHRMALLRHLHEQHSTVDRLITQYFDLVDHNTRSIAPCSQDGANLALPVKLQGAGRLQKKTFVIPPIVVRNFSAKQKLVRHVQPSELLINSTRDNSYAI
jgi:hypothetical protein